MTEPISWQALQSIGEFLGKIKKTDGYYTDAGLNVEYEPYQLDALDGQGLGILRVVEDDTDAFEDGRDARTGEVNVLIECYISVTDADAQLQAHRIRADVVKALPTRSRDLPVGIHTVTIGGRRIFQRPNGFPFIVVQVSLRVGLVESASPT